MNLKVQYQLHRYALSILSHITMDILCAARVPCYGRPWPAVYINFVLKIHQIQVLTEPLCRAQGSFYALPNNERGTKYRGLTYSARQNCLWICRQTRFRIWSVSIAVVRSIETPITTQNQPHQSITVHIGLNFFFGEIPKPTQNTPNHPKIPQTPPNHHRTCNALNFFGLEIP